MTKKKLELAVEELTQTYLIDAFDLDTFVQKVYKQEFSFVADQEMGNDSEKLFCNIDGVGDDGDYEDMLEFERSGEHYQLAHSLLQAFCGKGYIKPGNYVISICW